MAIFKFEHGNHEQEYALDVERNGEQLALIIKFQPNNILDVDIPPDQLEQWQQVAEREGKTVDEIVRIAISIAFDKLDKTGE